MSKDSLNPCFSGTYSRSLFIRPPGQGSTVLILVLVEHTLGARDDIVAELMLKVLILVLVEHTLGADAMSYINTDKLS